MQTTQIRHVLFGMLVCSCDLLTPATIAFAQRDDSGTFASLHRQSMVSLESMTGASDELIAVRARLVLGRKLGQADSEAGFQTIRDARELLSQTDQPNEWAYSEAALAELLLRTGEIQATGEKLVSLTARQTEITDLSVLSLIELARGFYLLRSGDSDGALDALRGARFKATNTGDDVLALYARHNEGVVLMASGDTLNAVDVMTDVKMRMELLASDDALSQVIRFNLAYLHNQSGNHAEALAGFDESWPWLVESHQWTRAYLAATQIAHALNALGRPQEAVDRLQEWVDRSDIAVAPDTEADAMLALGRAYLLLGRTDRTLHYLDKSGELLTLAANSFRYDERIVLEAEYLLNKGLTGPAQQLLNKTTARLGEESPSQIYLNLLRLQATAYELAASFEEAYETSRKVITVEQALRTAEHDSRLSSLRISNSLDLQQQELALLRARERTSEAREKNSSILLFSMSGIGLLLGVVAYLIWSKWVQERRMRETLEGRVSERAAQLKAEMNRRIQAERERAQMETRLAEDEKVRAIAQLTGGLAHDFNNLLTVISCSAELIKIKLASTDRDLDQLTDDIMSATDSGADVTKALIAYARQQPLRPQIIRLSEFFEQRQSLFQNTLGENIRLDMKLTEAVVEVDPASLTTSILNLLFNAKDALPDHGRVTILVSLLMKPGSSDMVCIAVSDTGKGMPSDVLGQAWEPFYTTKSDSNGSGLGLSMVYGFMKQSNGELRLASESEAGTTVYMYFPRVHPDKGEVHVEKATDSSLDMTGKRVLLVEDQAPILRLARNALESAGLEVATSADGAQAIEILNSGQRFDIVITDIVMPGRYDGTDVAAQARARDPATAILLTSGHADSVPREFELLSKPYSVNVLMQNVARLLEQRSAEIRYNNSVAHS